MRPSLPLCAVVLCLTALAACERTEPAASAPSAAPAQAGAEAPGAASEADDLSEADLAARRAAVAFAMTEADIASRPDGQWASQAAASSSYGETGNPVSPYAPGQATGAPNVSRYGDTGEAWAPATADAGIEWLELGFATPVHATSIHVRQNNAPGAIVRIDLIDVDGERHTVFDGVDETAYPSGTIVWFERSFAATETSIAGARITLATNAVPGWNEIDAVQLVGRPTS